MAWDNLGCAACYGRHRHSVNQPVFAMSSICCPPPLGLLELRAWSFRHHPLLGEVQCVRPAKTGIVPNAEGLGPNHSLAGRLGGVRMDGELPRREDLAVVPRSLRPGGKPTGLRPSQVSTGPPTSGSTARWKATSTAAGSAATSRLSRPDAAQLMSDDLASEAYVYGYPLMADVDEVIRFTLTGMGSVPAAPFNLFSHARTWRPRGHLRHSQQRHLGRRRWPWP